jgi:hypothetical protein
MSTVLLRPLHRTLEDTTGLLEFKLIDRRQDVLILEVWLGRTLFSHVILDFRIDSSFGLVVYPFANEKLVFIMIKVGTLTLT